MIDKCPRCGGRLSEFMDWVLMRYFRLCRACGWTDRPPKDADRPTVHLLLTR
jgi:hypothetical protein